MSSTSPVELQHESQAPGAAEARLDGGIERPGPASRGTVRFCFIDALRGLAALFVLVFHLFLGFHETPVFAHIHHWVRSTIWRGCTGVYIFFVISGFVIAYSIKERRVDGRFIGRFALRRSIRLDPSYWAATLVSALMAWKLHGISPHELPPPTLKLILAHFAYLPEFLGCKFFIGVFWTLCIEIQLYVTIVLLIGGLQWLSRTPEPPVGDAN
ncbi:MAG: acyltransferase [Anaerolineae bacterium]|nr:acyltransferase [Phycisphaerae bacterium]